MANPVLEFGFLGAVEGIVAAHIGQPSPCLVFAALASEKGATLVKRAVDRGSYDPWPRLWRSRVFEMQCDERILHCVFGKVAATKDAACSAMGSIEMRRGSVKQSRWTGWARARWVDVGIHGVAPAGVWAFALLARTHETGVQD